MEIQDMHHPSTPTPSINPPILPPTDGTQQSGQQHPPLPLTQGLLSYLGNYYTVSRALNTQTTGSPVCVVLLLVMAMFLSIESDSLPPPSFVILPLFPYPF